VKVAPLDQMNRRLRWKKGAYGLNYLAGWSGRSVRRDVVVRLLQQREWRLALTVAVMPSGYSLAKKGYRRG